MVLSNLYLLFFFSILVIATTTTHDVLSLATTQTSTDLYWKGYNWTIKTGKGGPGPNTWNTSTVSIDTQNRLHLDIQKDTRTNTWICSEIFSKNSFGYGNYTFIVEGSNVALVDEYIVLGLFSYFNDTREIDAEFSRWGNVSLVANNADFANQPSDIPANVLTYYIPSDTNGFHIEYIWTYESIVFTTKSLSSSWIKTWSRNGTSVPLASDELQVHLNLWLFRGHVPTKGASVIINNFIFTPL